LIDFKKVASQISEYYKDQNPDKLVKIYESLISVSKLQIYTLAKTLKREISDDIYIDMAQDLLVKVTEKSLGISNLYKYTSLRAKSYLLDQKVIYVDEVYSEEKKFDSTPDDLFKRRKYVRKLFDSLPDYQKIILYHLIEDPSQWVHYYKYYGEKILGLFKTHITARRVLKGTEMVPVIEDIYSLQKLFVLMGLRKFDVGLPVLALESSSLFNLSRTLGGTSVKIPTIKDLSEIIETSEKLSKTVEDGSVSGLQSLLKQNSHLLALLEVSTEGSKDTIGDYYLEFINRLLKACETAIYSHVEAIKREDVTRTMVKNLPIIYKEVKAHLFIIKNLIKTARELEK